MADLVLEQETGRQATGGGKGEKRGRKETAEASESLIFAAEIQAVFDRIYDLSGEQAAKYLFGLGDSGLPSGFVAEVRRVCGGVRDFYVCLGISGGGEKSVGDELLVDGAGLPGVARVGKNPLAVELFMKDEVLNALFLRGAEGYCDRVGGFARVEAEIKMGDQPSLEVPLICVKESRGAFSTITQRHERVHIENGILAKSRIAPDRPGFDEAWEAAWGLYFLNTAFDDEAVFSSSKWDTVQKFADNAMVDELVANWLSGESWGEVKEWFSDAISADSGLYNFFTRGLGIHTDFKHFRFIWNTYGQRVGHCVQAAFRLRDTYEKDSRMAERSRVLGRALSTVPLDEWEQYLEREGLVAEGEAINALLESAGRDVFPADFPDRVVRVRGVAHDTHAEFNRLTALEADRLRTAEEQKDAVFNSLLEHPERIVTGQALRGMREIEAILVR